MYFLSLKLFKVLKFIQFLMLFENQFLDTSSNFGAPNKGLFQLLILFKLGKFKDVLKYICLSFVSFSPVFYFCCIYYFGSLIFCCQFVAADINHSLIVKYYSPIFPYVSIFYSTNCQK